jgi:hypothetical protein
MALIIADRVKEVTATTGTGALIVSGTFDGFRAFSAVCGTSDTFYYSVQAVNASGQPTGEWETGLGTYTGANTIARTSVLSSSNGGSAVDFSAGDKHIWIDFVAAEYRTIRPIYDSYTITVGATGYDYTTVSAALASLDGRTIMPSAMVTIEIQDETVVEAARINIVHPNSDRITITGKTQVSTTLTSIQSTSGSLGAYSFVLNVGSVANIAIGDYALIYGTSGGSNPYAVQGCWKITDVDAVNTRITVATTNRKASLPSSTVAGSITIHKNVISWDVAATGGIYCEANTVGATLSNLTLEGNKSATSGNNGVTGTLRASGGANRIGISGFYRGVEAAGTRIALNNSIISSASNRGVSSVANGTVYAANGVVTGCGGGGVAATTASYPDAGNTVSAANTGAGFSGSFLGGTVYALDSVAAHNTTWGYQAVSISRIYAVGATVSDNTSGTYSPAVNTVGNDNSYIDT